MTTSKWYTSGRGQKSMQERSFAQLSSFYYEFSEIMSGSNPLTQDELRTLIAKRPRHGFMRAWLD